MSETTRADQKELDRLRDALGTNEWGSIDDLAVSLDCHRRTIRRKIKKFQIRTRRPNRTLLVFISGLKAVLDGQVEVPKAREPAPPTPRRGRPTGATAQAVAARRAAQRPP
jgi:hypothetical protein